MTIPRNGRSRMVRGAIAAIAITLAAGGCKNPFLPSAPELPSSEGSAISVEIDFSSPDGLLTTLSLAVAAKNHGNGFRAYMASFADSSTQGLGLRIDMDPDVVAERKEATVVIPPVWDRQSEAEFYNYLSTLNTGEYDLSFVPNAITDVLEPNHVIFHRTYILNATAPDGTTTQLATGNAELEMRQLPAPSSNWVITRWTDTIISSQVGPNPADPGMFCFSRLRIDSYNRR